MKWIVSFVITILLSACTNSTQPNNHLTFSIVSSGDFSFLPANSKTYAWHPASGKIYLHADDNSHGAKRIFDQTIETILQEKGYVPVSLNQQPDFLVGYGLAVESQINDEQIFEKTHMSTGVPAQDFDHSNEKGSLVITLYEPQRQQQRWQALGQTDAHFAEHTDGIELLIKSYVDTMLKTMPRAAL